METRKVFEVLDYELAATLTSGQAFRWRRSGEDWVSVVSGKWVKVRQEEGGPGSVSDSSSAQNSPPPRPSPQGEGEAAASKSSEGRAQGLLSPTLSSRGGEGEATPGRGAGNAAVGGLSGDGRSRLIVETAAEVSNWDWIEDYLQLHVDLDDVLRTFPDDEPMRAAVAACRGLRLLRQDPWECLASFILSSTKQIVQIQQIVASLCECFGESLPVPVGQPAAFGFPSAQRIASASEAELRACKMGFRAPYLRESAQAIVTGQFDPAKLRLLDVRDARTELMELPGVGGKIADCVLLFAGGFHSAFPVDVWVMKALRQLYFPRRRPSAKRLRRFTETYFGPYAGYAQQYLFHYMRTKGRGKSDK